MRRREFMKGLMAASVSGKAMLGQQSAAGGAAQQVAPATPPPTPPGAAPAPAPGPVPWMRGLLEVKPLPLQTLVPDAVASARAKFFSEEQMATLRQLCEIMMPPLKGFPGAMDAGAPEFLDFLISVSPPDRQQLYRTGLDTLNANAKKKFKMAFADLSDADADAVIRPLLAPVPWVYDPPKDPAVQFVAEAHRDIRTATQNSREWATAGSSSGRRRGGVGGGSYLKPIDPTYRS